MIWLAVNRDGTELMSNDLMVRASQWLKEDIERDYRYSLYISDCEGIWANSSSEGYFQVPKFNGVKLPHGTIRKLIGYDITWEDEPVKLKSYNDISERVSKINII